jgi:hypothetical protein
MQEAGTQRGKPMGVSCFSGPAFAGCRLSKVIASDRIHGVLPRFSNYRTYGGTLVSRVQDGLSVDVAQTSPVEPGFSGSRLDVLMTHHETSLLFAWLDEHRIVGQLRKVGTLAE